MTSAISKDIENTLIPKVKGNSTLKTIPPNRYVSFFNFTTWLSKSLCSLPIISLHSVLFWRPEGLMVRREMVRLRPNVVSIGDVYQGAGWSESITSPSSPLVDISKGKWHHWKAPSHMKYTQLREQKEAWDNKERNNLFLKPFTSESSNTNMGLKDY